MANLPLDKLPDSFETVVYGTGLTESIIAGAIARIGKPVLHIDGNSFYGELWGTLLHRDVEELVNNVPSDMPELASPPEEDKSQLHFQLLDGSECGISNRLFNVEDNIICSNDADSSTVPIDSSTVPIDSSTVPIDSSTVPVDSSTVPVDSSTIPVDSSTVPVDSSTIPVDSSTDVPVEPSTDVPVDGSTVPADSSSDVPVDSSTVPVKDTSISWKSLGKNIRRFNYDILPKLLHCRGKLVNLITSSGVSRYMEFKPVEKLYLFKDSTFLDVPSSRADVFSNKSVSMLDKRRLMKFLSSCVEDAIDYEAFRDQPYREFLMSSQSMSDTLADFIVYSIAFADDSISTAKGIEETKLFLSSLGRFGNAPFLYPIFGGGEIPQAFCRLCAVFGGVYCLKRSLKSIVMSESKSVKGIICSSNQRIECSKVVCGVSMLRNSVPSECINEVILSRAIFISDRPLIPNTEVSVATVLPGTMSKDQVKKIQLIQMDSSSLNTAQETYMVHATYEDKDYSVLKLIADQLYSQGKEFCDDKPCLLRSIYYNIKTYHVTDEGGVKSVLPDGVLLTSDPDATLSYESCVDQAKHIFSILYPNEEFLPRIPEPDEIIYEEYQPDDEENPVGNDGETPVGNDGETSVDNEKETPVVSNEETPVISIEETPVISNEETPVISNEETPVISNEETPVISNEEAPVISNEDPLVDNSEQ